MGLKDTMKKFWDKGKKIRKESVDKLVEDTKGTHKEMMDTIKGDEYTGTFKDNVKEAAQKGGKTNAGYFKKLGKNIADTAKQYGDLYKETAKEIYSKEEEENKE